jgi:hypothetical protein
MSNTDDKMEYEPADVELAVCSECGNVKESVFAGVTCLRDTSCDGEYELTTFVPKDD